ncbi:DBH-like monooxygenase protein 1 [Mya arenaria]|uniref:DBH-like monooxygenase protein 1 n=1 Tax=Mya arenaria TaxID=6604 RepID=UPI0022E6C965|nr:DBH-like monooxygenase protein 1 [Mya arenaria]
MKTVLCFVALCVALTASRTPTETYPRTVVIDPNFSMFWKFNNTHITIEMHLTMGGWAGLGLTKDPSGAMFPGDVMIGYVLNNKGVIADYHTVGHSPPIKDASQDITLLYAHSDHAGSVLKFVRPLDTGDSQDDITILPGANHVIFAYTESDPANLAYHKTNRGSADIALLDINEPPVGK